MNTTEKLIALASAVSDSFTVLWAAEQDFERDPTKETADALKEAIDGYFAACEAQREFHLQVSE